MTLLFALFLIAHGLIHLLGVAKAFRWADLPQLTQPVSVLFGAMWLAAALLFLGAAASLFVWPRGWWAIGMAAIVVSTIAVVPSWADAKVGAFANVVALVGVLFGFLAQGPTSLQAAFERDVDRRLSSHAPGGAISEADLQPLPPPVRRYLRTSGVVGQPRVRNFHARMHGRFRNGRGARWMPFNAEQYNFVDAPARFFLMHASQTFVPFQGYHRYAGSSASMLVKVAALVPVVDVSGDEMTRAETVTLFNDMCVMAPATLIEPTIAWQAVDDRTVRATFSNAGHTVRAELVFNEAGELTNFWSDDRRQVSPDSGTLVAARWSTPLGHSRTFGSYRLASSGEARWHEPAGEYAYIELEIDEIRYNLASR